MWAWIGTLVTILGLMLVFSTVSAILLLVRTGRLSRRIAALEARPAAVATMPPVPDEVLPAPVPPEAERAAGEPVAAEAETIPDQAAFETAEAPEPPPQDQPLVFREDRFAALAGWLKENWVYVVSAVSLALAGVYFVQYGIERGLLSPAMRVAGAGLLGLALIAAGEWMRRRGGAAVAFLPAGFAGAGLVSLFAAVVAARMLYGLIGAELAFALLVAVSAGGVLLGWLHGPFLAAFGLIGATVAPFAVGGSAETPWWLYGYFTLVAATGLAIDAGRRWAWISALALILGYGSLFFVQQAVGGTGWFALALVVLAAAAVLVPMLSLTPRHDGPAVSETILRGGKGAWPSFPVRLAAGAVAASALGLALIPGEAAADSMLALVCLTVLAVALILWSAEAPALSDLAALPAVGLAVRLVVEAEAAGPLHQHYLSLAIGFREPESAAPWTASAILALGVAMTLAAAWRSGFAPWRAGFAAAAALAAPVVAVLLELFWAPSAVAGAYPWALQVIALAALMAVLAERFARADGEDRRRAAYAVLSCLSLIALALFVVVTKGALTVALGVLVVAAVALDRRYRLPEMGWFVQAGVMVLGWRLYVDPGIGWGVDGPLWEVLLAFAGALGGLAAALVLLPEGRRGARIFLESGLFGAAALLVNVLLLRWFEASGIGFEFWAVSLQGLPWLLVMLGQLWRLQLGGWMRWVRGGIAVLAGLLFLSALLLAVFPLNPLVAWPAVPLGPPLLDKLFLAYGLPALVLLAAAPRMRHLPRWLHRGLAGIGTALAALYVGLEIRRAFHGDALNDPGVTQGELYSYTLALMLLGAALLGAAILRRSAALRWAAMAVIVVTVAKVFLIDAAGLAGLMRVVAFLGLGLALAGVALLNRWAARQEEGASPG